MSEDKKISKRRFLEWIGGAAAFSLISGCVSEKRVQSAAEGAGRLASLKNKLGSMEYRINRKNGDKVSLIGFGCMRYPTLTSGADQGKIDEEMGQRLVDAAYAGGINYFDTAYVYHGGKSEEATGKFLKKYDRRSFYIATKMPGRIVESLDHAKKIFEEQLANLQTDYIDYYLLHNLNSMQQYKKIYEEFGVLDYLIEQKKQGRIRNLGWSFHGNSELFKYVLGVKDDWDFVQIQLNYHDWELGPGVNDEKYPVTAKWMYEELTKKDIPIVVMEPLLGGALSSLPGGANAVLKEAAPDRSIASWAFRFCGSLPNVLTALSGMTYMEHLEDNLRTFAPFTALSDKEQEALNRASAISDKAKRVPCTGCQYCMPCPYDVNIAGIFRHYNKCIAEAEFPKSSWDPKYAEARKNFLLSYARSFDSIEQADHCIGCQECLKKCPQNINIPSELEHIHNFIEKLRRQRS